MDKSKHFIKTFLIILLIGTVSYTFGQTVSFSASKTSNIDIGEIIQLVNTSTDMPQVVTYKWEFQNCSFVIDSILRCDFVQEEQNNTISGFFVQTGSFVVNVTAYDENNSIIGSSASKTFYLNPAAGCASICHDNLPFSCTNQNLICNSSFEYLSNNITFQGQLSYAEPWCNLGSSDAFMTGMVPYPPPPYPGSLSLDIPQNAMGYQQPHSGNKYAGLINFIYSADQNKPLNMVEYISTPVKEAIVNGTTTNTLFSGQRYGLSFYFSKAENNKFATDGLQAYLSANQLANGGSGASQYTIVKQESDPNFLHPFDNTIV